jgi:hypothetical protein
MTFGPLLWIGAFNLDPANPIVMLVWRYQPSGQLSSPDQAQSMVDEFAKNAASIPGISNVTQASVTNADTLVDGVHYDLTAKGKTTTLWTLVAQNKLYSYFIVVAGDQQPMLRANPALNQMVNSIVVN